MPNIQVKRFPYPAYSTDLQSQLLQYIAPLFMLFSLNYTFANTVRYVALEKEKQLKESMKIMGLNNWLHWLSWFIRTMTMMYISVTLIIILLKVNFDNNGKCAYYRSVCSYRRKFKILNTLVVEIIKPHS